MEKLELDFQFWRFWAFTLLAIIATLTIGFFNMSFQKNPWASDIGWLVLVFIFAWFISTAMFYKTYYEYRKKLS